MKIVKSQIHRGMPDSEYFKLSDHVGSSELKDYIQSPYGHKLRYIDKIESCQFTGNRGTDVGTMFDDLICDHLSGGMGDIVSFVGEVYPDEWLTKSGRLSQTKEIQSEVAKAEAEGKKFKTPEQWQKDLDQLKLMVDSFTSNREIARSLDEVTATQLVITSETAAGLKLRGKLDLETKSGGYDIKTGRVHPDDFLRHAINYGYHFQKVFYQDQYDEATGIIGSKYSFLYQQNCYPFESAKIELPFDLERMARIKVYEAIAGLERKDHEHKHIHTFKPEAPAWLIYEMDGE